MAYVHLYPEEQKIVEDWLLKHDAACTLPRLPGGARAMGFAGERLAFKVIPTAVGNLTDVECACGAKLSLPAEEEGVLMGKPEYHDPPPK